MGLAVFRAEGTFTLPGFGNGLPGEAGSSENASLCGRVALETSLVSSMI